MTNKSPRQREKKTTTVKSKVKSSLNLRRHTHRLLAVRLMHKAHKTVNTSGVLKLPSDWLNSTRFPGDMYVTFFNGP